MTTRLPSLQKVIDDVPVLLNDRLARCANGSAFMGLTKIERHEARRIRRALALLEVIRDSVDFDETDNFSDDQ